MQRNIRISLDALRVMAQVLEVLDGISSCSWACGPFKRRRWSTSGLAKGSFQENLCVYWRGQGTSESRESGHDLQQRREGKRRQCSACQGWELSLVCLGGQKHPGSEGTSISGDEASGAGAALF